MKMISASKGDVFCSGHVDSNHRCLIIVSRNSDSGIDLLLSWQSINLKSKKSLGYYLKAAANLEDSLDPIFVRNLLPVNWKKELSRHLLESQQKVDKEFESVAEKSARHFQLLQTWGEISAVSAIAQYEKVSVNTIKARLYQSRLKGLIAEPGQGKRIVK
jgi:hypothetical protein